MKTPSGSNPAFTPFVRRASVGESGSNTSTQARNASGARTSVAWPPSGASAARTAAAAPSVGALVEPDEAAAPIAEMAQRRPAEARDEARPLRRRKADAPDGALLRLGEELDVAHRAPQAARVLAAQRVSGAEMGVERDETLDAVVHRIGEAFDTQQGAADTPGPCRGRSTRPR